MGNLSGLQGNTHIVFFHTCFAVLRAAPLDHGRRPVRLWRPPRPDFERRAPRPTMDPEVFRDAQSFSFVRHLRFIRSPACGAAVRTTVRRAQPIPRTHTHYRGTHRRHAQAGRLFPAVLGRAHRQFVAGDCAPRQRLPLGNRCRRGTGVERHRPGPRAGGRRQDRLVSARRPQAAAGAGK